VSLAPLRIFLIEDESPPNRPRLADVLTQSGFRVVAEAGSVAAAREVAPRIARYDVALIDRELPDGDAIELAGELRRDNPDAKVVLLAADEEPGDLFRALRRGVDGYLDRDLPPARLVKTLRAAARGEAPLSRRMTAQLVQEYQRINQAHGQRASQVRAHLTLREWQILCMLADGKRTSDIADELVVSTETVRSHVKAVLRKLGVHSRAAAIARLDEPAHV
jgi:two-component system, NarL family, nitrate/nitrite response regulator NarL